MPGVYFACEISLKETVARCFLHVPKGLASRRPKGLASRRPKGLASRRNTLQYRLKRIRDCCGLDPRRFRDVAMLYMAPTQS
ncbi:MAG: helix-turn-helix domain-containing protein [Clostridia bacterium]|nr:helix-turn-helix domain-containing protein [Clostridia bacterium]